MDWRHESASCAVTLFTTREVGTGEELCISYIGQGGNEMGVRERRRKLMGWFGMDCGCGKCVREAREEGEERVVVDEGTVEELSEKIVELEVV